MPATVLIYLVAKKTQNNESHSHAVFSFNRRDDTIIYITIQHGRRQRSWLNKNDIWKYLEGEISCSWKELGETSPRKKNFRGWIGICKAEAGWESVAVDRATQAREQDNSGLILGDTILLIMLGNREQANFSQSFKERKKGTIYVQYLKLSNLLIPTP